MGRERRKQKRLKSNLFVEFEDPVLRDIIGRGVVVDVSVGGVAVETEAELKEGRTYPCHIEIPLNIKARLVRKLKEGHVKKYGFKIVGQGFLDRLVLRKLLKGKIETRKIR